MELVLNELSIKQSNRQVARHRMKTLLLLIKKAIEAGASRSLRTHAAFLTDWISADYPVYAWLTDPEVEVELKRYFKSLTTRYPYIDKQVDVTAYEQSLITDFSYNSQPARGLAAAYLLDGLAVSLDLEFWDSPFIQLEGEFIDEDTTDVHVEEVSVVHASKFEHITFHDNWFKSYKHSRIRDGRDIVKWSSDLFPSLILCPRVIGQLVEYKNGFPLLRQLVKHLILLEEYFSKWSNGGFNPSLIPFKVTPESKPTIDAYKSEHTFVCPDEVYRLFTWHFRLTPGAIRVFFYPDEFQRKAFIGHVGDKLPTVNFPH